MISVSSLLGKRRLPRRGIQVTVNLTGAASAAWFARASLVYFAETHRLIGALFCVEQTWFVVAFLLRRPAQSVDRSLPSWLLAAGGTFGGLVLRPTGSHPLWGVRAGFILQVTGLVVVIVSLFALGRSFGFVAADRGLITRGPYRIARHPMYAGYLMIQVGYVLQAISWRNIIVVLAVTGCNAGRALAEERVLGASASYQSYRERVRWRLLPGIW
jgi:protein-S-isoprenylcysteine O-methyltransferase Ste14